MWTGAAQSLRSGDTRSCGCLQRERATLSAAEARGRREHDAAARAAEKVAADAERTHRAAHAAWMASRELGGAPRCADAGCSEPRYLRGLCDQHYHAALSADLAAERDPIAA
jgi:hypothetical protein